ncbi:MAG: hypothetical protein JNK56_39485 [Myxococcales bacterium]|nr:hypothetical protein [Myxococcales bacterium]
MSLTTYPQLDDETLALLKAGVEREGSIAAAASRLDYGRTSVSQALGRRYPGDTRHMAQAIRDTFGARHDCPALDRPVTPGECRAIAARPLSTQSPQAVRQWRACRACPRHQSPGQSAGRGHREGTA